MVWCEIVVNLAIAIFAFLFLEGHIKPRFVELCYYLSSCMAELTDVRSVTTFFFMRTLNLPLELQGVSSDKALRSFLMGLPDPIHPSNHRESGCYHQYGKTEDVFNQMGHSSSYYFDTDISILHLYSCEHAGFANVTSYTILH